MSWWKSIRESLKPKGLTYICAEGHTLFVPHERLLEYLKVDDPYLPVECPDCADHRPSEVPIAD